MKKIYIAVALFLLYIASPYYAVYSFINYLNEGDTIGLKKVVDFPALRESLKDEMKSKLVQQTKRSISSKEEEVADKLVSGMGAMFGPAIIDGLVDTFVTPSGLAGLISNPSSALDGKKSKNDNKIPNISWAFFSGLTEFQAKFTEKQETLTMHFRLTDFRWVLYAITWKDENSGNSGVDPLETVMPKKTDTSTVITPVGYWCAEDHPSNFLLQLTDNGEAINNASRKASYKIDGKNVFKITVIKDNNEVTIARITQLNNNEIILSDISQENKPEQRLSRIGESRFAELLIDRQNAGKDFAIKHGAAKSFHLSIFSANLENQISDKPSIYPFDMKCINADEYLSRLSDSDFIDRKNAGIIRDNFQIVNISDTDLPETPFLILRDSCKAKNNKIIVLFKDGTIKEVDNQNDLPLPKRIPAILPD